MNFFLAWEYSDNSPSFVSSCPFFLADPLALAFAVGFGLWALGFAEALLLAFPAALAFAFALGTA